MNDPARRTARGEADARLNRESWRIFQIMAEFVEGFEKLVHIEPSTAEEEILLEL